MILPDIVLRISWTKLRFLCSMTNEKNKEFNFIKLHIIVAKGCKNMRNFSSSMNIALGEF